MATQNFILINDMRPIMSVGLYDTERQKKQIVEINLRLSVSAPQHVHDLDETVCYHALYMDIEALCQSRHFDMLEELAEDITQLCFTRSRVEAVEIRLLKPEAIIGSTQVGIELITSRA
jgi:FolB domain